MNTRNSSCANVKGRVTLALVLFLFFGYSCTKSSSAHPSYHVSCKVNGVPMTFTLNVEAVIEHGSGETSLAIGGLLDSSLTTPGVGFVIINDPAEQPIVKGTYVDSSTSFQVLATYEPDIADLSLDYNGGSSVYQDAAQAGFDIPNHFKATITSLTSKTVTGIFSGDCYRYYDNFSTAEKVSLTDGDFYAAIQQ
jgi:hypothetical protein